MGFGIILPVIDKKFDFTIQAMGGRGIGRYGTANGSDVTLRPDGTIVPILSYQTLIGLELHPTSKWDLWLYGGNEYFGRAAYAGGVGYGSRLNNLSGCNLETPSSSQPCNAQNRDVWQIQPGFCYRFWRGKEGTVQYGMSYSYVHRKAWAGTVGTSVGVSNPVGINNILMTSLAVLLPVVRASKASRWRNNEASASERAWKPAGPFYPSLSGGHSSGSEASRQ